jgi:PAS domain S-box-containing protein
MAKGGRKSSKAKSSVFLRTRAEEMLQRQTGETEYIPYADSEELVHELQVHQIELEIQNEELRGAQRQLETAYNKYFDLFDLAPIGYFRISEKGQIRQVNLTGADLLGTERAYLEGRLFSHFVAKDNQNVFYAHLKNTLETGGVGRCELAVKPKDGDLRYALMRSVPVDDGEGKKELLSAVLDITERKNLEKDLVNSEERYRTFCENAPDIIARFDEHLRHIYVNPAVEEVTGLSRDAFIGKTNEELGMPRRLCEEWNRILRRVFRTGKTEIGEFDFPSSNGTIWFHWRVFPEFSKEGTISNVLTIARDITALRAAQDELERKVEERTEELVTVNKSLKAEVRKRRSSERALRKSRNEALEESNQRRYLSRNLVDTLEKDRREVAMALHDEIGQILATLKMNLESIKTKSPALPEAATQQLSKAEDRVIEAVRRIKDISRELRPSVLDRLGLIPSIRTLLDDVKENLNIQVDLFSGDLPKPLDPGVELALFRIAQEALTNVMKHGRASKVYLSIAKKDGSILLSIEDDGVGFKHNGIRSEVKSLGIMIMKERAAMLGGEVHIESSPGKGTHVIVEIPINQ